MCVKLSVLRYKASSSLKGWGVLVNVFTCVALYTKVHLADSVYPVQPPRSVVSELGSALFEYVPITGLQSKKG